MIAPTFPSMVVREWRVLSADSWLFCLVSWFPPLLFFVMWSIMSAGIARDLPIGIVDLDNSAMSRSLIRHYDASSALATDYSYPDVQQGAVALRAGKIYGLVILPANLEKMTILGRPPQVSAFINSQFLLVGKIINSAIMQAQGTFTTKVEIRKNLATGLPVFDMALANAVPVGNKITPLFNINTNYAQFLVSAILPAIWQILMVAATILSLAAEQRRHGLEKWLGTQPIRALLAKLLPLLLLFWLHGMFFLSFMYVFLGWPMHGNWILLFFAQGLTVCASLAAASVFFFLTLDAARGLSLAAAYAAPGLAFMGVTFPVTDMTLPAKIWRSFLPISHYIQIQFGQVNYGEPLVAEVPQLTHLGLFLLLLFFCFYRVSKLKVVPSGREVNV